LKWVLKLSPLFLGFALVTPTAAQASSYQQVYAFARGSGNDGEYPYATLIKVGNILLGTTAYGHASGAACAEISVDGRGIVYSITP
jgi:hypothetical protein